MPDMDKVTGALEHCRAGEENNETPCHDCPYMDYGITCREKLYYRWDDGWEACVSVRRMPVNEARKLERRSDGFCGYDWMITSIVNKGCIEPEHGG